MTNTINLIRDHRTFDVNISDRVALTVQVEPPTANVAVTVDGSPIATDGTGKTQAQLKFGQVYSVQVPSEVLVAAGTRLFFVKWSDGQTSNSRTHSANDDAALTAEYKTQHLLSVLPQLGNPQGSGWYDVGTTATISVTSPWPVEGFLGVLGGKYMFDHWSGGATGTAPSVSLTMDGPKTVTAEWREDNTIPYAIIGAVLGIALVAAAIVVKRRKSPRLN